MKSRGSRVACVLVTMAGILCAAAGASAGETSRAEYVAAVEPICKANTEANERILAGVRGEVAHGRLGSAAAKFEAAAKALERTLGELKTVPRPQDDVARLKRWFGDIEVEIGLFKGTATKLRAGQKAAAERMSVKLTTAANRANDQVLDFEFRYCRAEPARFT